MLRLFLSLTALNLLSLLAATLLGYARAAGRVGEVHMAVGAMSALVCVAVHCVVFTYFVATAKWVRHAVEVKHLDLALLTPTRSFKAQAFPAAVAAMAAVFASAVLGAQADLYRGAWVPVHHAAALAALLVNGIVAAIEYRSIARNGRLIDEILARIGSPGEEQ